MTIYLIGVFITLILMGVDYALRIYWNSKKLYGKNDFNIYVEAIGFITCVSILVWPVTIPLYIYCFAHTKYNKREWF